MGDPRTIGQLVEELGCSKHDRSPLRSDLFSFLDSITGSDEKTTKIPARQIRQYCQQFIDSDKGRVYFSRGDTLTDWKHHVPQEEVTDALNELTVKWLKARKTEMKKHEAAYTPRKSSSTPQKKTLATASKSPTTPASQYRFTAVNRQGMTEVGRPQADSDVLSDGETDSASDNGTLPDIEAVLSTQDIAFTHTPSVAPLTPNTSRDNAKTNSTGMSGPDVRTTSTSVEPQTSAQTTTGGTPKSPESTLKRKHDTSESRDVTQYDETARRQSVTQKRVRLSLEPMTKAPTASPSGPVELSPGSTSHSSTQPSPSKHNFPKEPPDPTHEQAVRSPGEGNTYVTHLSFTRAYSQQVSSRLDALLAIPATILDYVNMCEKSSLAKANSKDTISPAERKRYQERSRIFRDLQADIESRIMSLASREVKGEYEVDVVDLERGTEASAGGVQISSYCLWD